MPVDLTTEELEARFAADLRVKRVRGRYSASSQERAEARKCLDFVDGDAVGQLKPMAQESDEHYARKGKYGPLLVGSVVDKLTHLYSLPPVRSVFGDDDGSRAGAWASALWDYRGGLDLAMEEADRLARVTGTALVVCRPGFASAADAGAYFPGMDFTTCEGVRLSVHPRQDFDFTLDRLSGALESVWVRWSSSKSGDVFHYWDSEVMRVYHGKELVEERLHGLGGVPCAVVRNTYGDGHGRKLGGKDARKTWRTIYRQIQEYLYTAYLQRGQPVIVGDRNVEGSFGPDSPIFGDQAGFFQIVGNAAQLSGMLEAIKVGAAMLALSYGAPRHTLDVGTAPDYARDSAELAKDRKKREKLAKSWERDVHAAAALVANAYGLAVRYGVDSFDASQVSTRFTAHPPVVSVADAQARSQFELMNGLSDRVDAILEIHPDLTRAEALERIARADSDEGSPYMRAVTIAGHAGDIDNTDTGGDDASGTDTRTDDAGASGAE